MKAGADVVPAPQAESGMGVDADVQRCAAQAYGAVGVAVEMPATALRTAPFEDGVMEHDQGDAVAGFFVVGLDPVEALGEVGIGAEFVVVVAADQADFAVEFGEQAEGFGEAAEGDIAQVIDAVTFANLGVPAGDDGFVHLAHAAEGAVAVFDDAVVKKVRIRGEKYCHACFH